MPQNPHSCLRKNTSNLTPRRVYTFFDQDGVRIDEDSTMLLLRQIMVIGCEPNKVGAMCTGSAPLDPIFWVLHSGFEKAQHILQLSPGYRDTYDFEWVDDGECDEGVSGGGLDDVLPFTGMIGHVLDVCFYDCSRDSFS